MSELLRAISDFISGATIRFEQPPEIDWAAKAEMDRRYATARLRSEAPIQPLKGE